MQFGMAVITDTAPGVMGVGFSTLEALTHADPNILPFPGVLDQMVAQKVIPSRTFSLYLNDIDASTGQVIFGGVDTGKFQGELATFPINTDPTGQGSIYAITLTSMSLTMGGTTTSVGSNGTYPISALLDSGTSLMAVSVDMAKDLVEAFGASITSDSFPLPNCSLQSSTGFLNFGFSGFTLAVPISELIVPNTETDGGCALGIMVVEEPFDPTTGENLVILGDTFLRSAYVVYDLVILILSPFTPAPSSVP
jgi:Eukaryotic aspartyl protease